MPPSPSIPRRSAKAAPFALRRSVLAAALLLVIAPACGDRDSASPDAGGSAAAPAPPTVYTTFYPTAWFAERIAGDLARVVCPVPDGEDPIFWRPPEDVLQAYQQADLIVLNGAGFAKWVEQASLPASKVVDTSAPFEDTFIRYEDSVTHSHGPAGEHSHEGIDGHTWLDPVNAKIQAGEIHAALRRLLPDHAESLDEGFRALAADLDSLDAGFRALTASGGGPLLASHPAYNYLARRYGWNVRNLDLDPDTMPDDEVFEAIRADLEVHPAKFLLWEGEPDPAIAGRFQTELGIRSITVSPCELLGEDEAAAGENYLTVMRRNIEALRPAFD